MCIFLKYKLKIIITILFSLLIYVLFFLGDMFTNWSFVSSKVYIAEIARTKKVEIEKELYVAHSIATTIANSIEGQLHTNIITLYQRRSILNQLFYTLQNNPKYFGVWCSFEPNVFMVEDSFFIGQPGHMKDGTFSPYWYRYEDTIKLQTLEETLENQYEEDYYNVIEEQQSILTNPYLYKILKEQKIKEDGSKEYIYDTVDMITISVPIYKNDIILGAVGVDILKIYFNNIIHKEIESYLNGVVITLISNNGDILASTNSNFKDKNLFTDIYLLPEKKDNYDLVKYNIINGIFFTLEDYCIIEKKQAYKKFVPIKIDNVKNTWTLLISIPIDQMKKDGNMLVRGIVFTISMSMLFILFKSK